MNRGFFGIIVFFLFCFFISPKLVLADYLRLRGREGFWRVAQDQNKVWWFLSPENQKEFLNLIQNVNPEEKSINSQGPNYISKVYLESGMNKKIWAQKTIEQINNFGFKAIGAWSDPILLDADVPITKDLNVLRWVDYNTIKIFDPRWSAQIREAIRKQVLPLKNHKNLIGYYLDNELPWWTWGLGAPYLYFDGLAKDDPNRVQMKGTIRELWKTPVEFSQATGLKISSWEELDELDSISQIKQAAYDRLAEAWLGIVAKEYFQKTHQFIREFDPNHLILGVRFAKFANENVVRASRGLVDVHSLNFYSADARFDQKTFETLYRLGDAPIVISEFSFYSPQNNSGNLNFVGFSGFVSNQKNRALGYRQFMKNATSLPYVLGADWFQYNDQPPMGRFDGENANTGVVDIEDRPYEELVSEIRSSKDSLNFLHSKSSASESPNVWRVSPHSFLRPHKKINFSDKISERDFSCSRISTDFTVLSDVKRFENIGFDLQSQKKTEVYGLKSSLSTEFYVKVYDSSFLPKSSLSELKYGDHLTFFISKDSSIPHGVNYFQEFARGYFFIPDSNLSEGGRLIHFRRPSHQKSGSTINPPFTRFKACYFLDHYILHLEVLDAVFGESFSQEIFKNNQMGFYFSAINRDKATEDHWGSNPEFPPHYHPLTWGILSW
jgi:hypothetical protein